jgi:glutamate 5-kinase
MAGKANVRKMVDPVRQEVVSTARTVVVKIGTSVLTRPDGTLDRACVRRLCRDVVSILATGRRLVVVSSGAVGAGVGALGWKRRPSDLPHLQAAAAVGQSHLIRTYDEAFRRHGYLAAQLLLTAEDFADRTRYLNVRNTLWTLFETKAIPVVNENDTISTEEIRFGDNDRLAALVTNLVQAPLLIILSVVDGLYLPTPSSADGRPETGPLERAILSTVTEITDEIRQLAQPTQSAFGTGGMISKLEAARMCTAAGESVILANGRKPEILRRIMAAEEVGTLFLAHGGLLKAKKRWIAYSARPRGQIVVDDGAAAALCRQGKSLLPVGVVAVHGSFQPGDLVLVVRADGSEVGRGLTNYSSEELARIRGLRSDQVRRLLGPCSYDEVIHRDNLVIKA